MPLHAAVDINGSVLGHVHIGRLEVLANDEQTSEYIAWVGNFHDLMSPKNSARFMHKYDEGALVCIRKGLSALEAAGIDFD